MIDVKSYVSESLEIIPSHSRLRPILVDELLVAQSLDNLWRLEELQLLHHVLPQLLRNLNAFRFVHNGCHPVPQWI